MPSQLLSAREMEVGDLHTQAVQIATLGERFRSWNSGRKSGKPFTHSPSVHFRRRLGMGT